MSAVSLSTHVLDTSRGAPGAGMQVDLFQRQQSAGWCLLLSATTTEDGRCANLSGRTPLPPATYKLRFHVGPYYTRDNVHTLYPFVEVVFETKENQHYHIPLLISPYGYSTYRGS